MVSLYRVSYLNVASKKPTVKFEYAEDGEEALSKVLQDDCLVSELKIKRIKSNSELLDAARDLDQNDP